MRLSPRFLKLARFLRRSRIALEPDDVVALCRPPNSTKTEGARQLGLLSLLHRARLPTLAPLVWAALAHRALSPMMSSLFADPTLEP